MLLSLREKAVEEAVQMPSVSTESGADHQNHPSLGSEKMIKGLISASTLSASALGLSFARLWQAMHCSIGQCQSRPEKCSKLSSLPY